MEINSSERTISHTNVRVLIGSTLLNVEALCKSNFKAHNTNSSKDKGEF